VCHPQTRGERTSAWSIFLVGRTSGSRAIRGWMLVYIPRSSCLLTNIQLALGEALACVARPVHYVMVYIICQLHRYRRLCRVFINRTATYITRRVLEASSSTCVPRWADVHRHRIPNPTRRTAINSQRFGTVVGIRHRLFFGLVIINKPLVLIAHCRFQRDINRISKYERWLIDWLIDWCFMAMGRFDSISVGRG